MGDSFCYVFVKFITQTNITMKTNAFIFFLAGLFMTTLTFAQDKDIVALAMEQDNLSTLVEAVKAAELVETLQSDGPFTVFAPTNEAFAALPEGTLESLLKPENKDKLVAVLTYHVVSGKVLSSDLSDGMQAATVEGSNAEVMLKDGEAMIEGAKVVAADVEASNGVVHVIDAVILPPSMTGTAQGEKEEDNY
jgi:uncharacterized surface protein with fasciclin (FAS1) repeats